MSKDPNAQFQKAISRLEKQYNEWKALWIKAKDPDVKKDLKRKMDDCEVKIMEIHKKMK